LKDTKAGPIDRAGFIEAPDIRPQTKAQIKTVNPMANPAVITCSLNPVAKLMIRNINVKVIMIYMIIVCIMPPLGKVSPRVMASGKRLFNAILARMVPSI